MPTSPTHALAHLFMPNLLKLKGIATIQGVIDRKEKFFFDQVWNQAHVQHLAALVSVSRDPYRIGVVDLPPPKDMGEAHFVAFVSRVDDPQYAKLYLLEHDYVLATKADRTFITEKDGNRHIKHFEGPALTGDKEADMRAFANAVPGVKDA